jgi:holo-ACP synthase CitX
MAPSSTPYDESRRSAEADGLRQGLLAARDDRQAVLDRQLGGGRTLVALSLAIPGEDKKPPGAGALFAWAAAEVERAFPGADRLHANDDALGPFALWAVPLAGVEAKARCTAVEAARDAARLVDLDVYSPEGAPVDRASLHLPPRPCLCCAEPARECIRARRHDLGEVVGRAAALLASL